MTDQDRLEELLNRWEDLRSEKKLVSDEELCRDCPELLGEFRRRVAELKRIDGFLDYGLNDPGEEELTAAGRYRPLQLYAHGGLGEVFMARDEELGREVALKRMRSLEAGNPQRVRRFQFEAEITGRLDHPGVVPVYGLGHDACGRLYYAMRFIHGETLQQAVDRFHESYPPGKDQATRAIAFQKLIRSFLTVCQTIGYAHSQDVIHRDLKPANIMLGHYGETLVVDWGLAKRLVRRPSADAETLDMSATAATEPADRTLLGQVKGSPAYMSPEQAEGRIDRIGVRSDIYSLGATLYTILAGMVPFPDMDLHQLLDHVKRGDFHRPGQVRGDVPPALEAVCLKAMSLNPADRYATALEMAADLEHWLADDPVSAWREPWSVRARRWVRKHQTLASTAAAAVLITLLGISALAVEQQQSNRILDETNKQLLAANEKEAAQTRKAEAAEKRAREAAEQAQLEAKKARIAEREARRELYSFLILSADRALAAGDRGFAEETLEQCPEELRNIEWRLLYRRTAQSQQTWRIHDGLITSVALSHDGTRIAAADVNGPVRVYAVADGKPLAELAGPAKRVAFLPDGDHLLIQLVSQHVLAPGPVEIWSIEQKKRIGDFSADFDRFTLSGDGTRVALISVKWPGPLENAQGLLSRIHVCGALSGKLIALTDSIPGDVADAAFSPDHLRLYAIVRQVNMQKLSFAAGFLRGDFGATPFQLQAWNVAGARELKLLKPVLGKDGPENADVIAMAISPDGKQILVSDKNQQQKKSPQLFNTGLPTLTKLTPGRVIILDAATGATVSADGYNLTSSALAAPPPANRPIDISRLLDHVGALDISPDGKRLAVVCGNRVLVFERKSGARVAELPGHVTRPQSVAFDRDGKGLFTAGGEDGRIKRWLFAPPSATRIELPSGQASQGRGVAFSSDSRLAAVASADGGIEIFTVDGGRRMTIPPLSSAVAKEKLAEANRLLPLEENAKYVAGQRAGEIQFSPDGARLTAIHYDRNICVWDISGKNPVVADFLDSLTLDKEQEPHLLTHALVLSPGGRYLAADLHRPLNRRVCVWEIEHRRLVVSHENDTFLGANPTMSFSRDGKTFLLERTFPQAAPRVLAWDLASGKPTEAAAAARLVAPEQLTPDGSRRLRIVGGVLKIDDCRSGLTLLEFADQNPYLWAILSPDGYHILACKGNTAELLDAGPIAGPVVANAGQVMERN